MDILPTIAEITGAPLPEKKIDGVSILQLLKGDFSVTPRHDLYYYYQQNNLEAVQRDYWKLVLPHTGQTYRGQTPGKDGWPGPTGRETITEPELYDLRRDPGEWYNVAEFYPEKVAELQILAGEARMDLGDNITRIQGANRRKAGTIAMPEEER